MGDSRRPKYTKQAAPDDEMVRFREVGHSRGFSKMGEGLIGRRGQSFGHKLGNLTNLGQLPPVMANNHSDGIAKFVSSLIKTARRTLRVRVD